MTSNNLFSSFLSSTNVLTIDRKLHQTTITLSPVSDLIYSWMHNICLRKIHLLTCHRQFLFHGNKNRNCINLKKVTFLYSLRVFSFSLIFLCHLFYFAQITAINNKHFVYCIFSDMLKQTAINHLNLMWSNNETAYQLLAIFI